MDANVESQVFEIGTYMKLMKRCGTTHYSAQSSVGVFVCLCTY